MMKTWLLLSMTTAFLSIAGCKTGPLEEMEQVKEKMCACENQACIKALEDEFTAMQSKSDSLNRKDQERAIKISLDALECATRLSR